MFELYIKYLLEGIAVAVAAYFIPRKKVEISEIIFIALSAAATFAVLDIFAPKVGDGARKGAGFGIGANTVGWPMGGAENFGSYSGTSYKGMKQPMESFYTKHDKKDHSKDSSDDSSHSEDSSKHTKDMEELKKKLKKETDRNKREMLQKEIEKLEKKEAKDKMASSEDSKSTASSVTDSSSKSTETGSSNTKTMETMSVEMKSDDTKSKESSDSNDSKSMDSTGSAVMGFDHTKGYSSF